jgi:VanZ family protein
MLENVQFAGMTLRWRNARLSEFYLLFRVLWICGTIFVCVMSLLPESMLEEAEEYMSLQWLGDKVLHGVAYFGLALLAVLSFPRRRAGLIAAFAMVLIGIALEFAQQLSPGRTADLLDAAVNGLGVMIGAAVGSLL